MLAGLMLLSLPPSLDPAALGVGDEPRVKTARAEHAASIEKTFAAAAVPYPAHALLLRVFKLDDVLELWAQPTKDAPYVLLETYPICARSGVPGPKRREGDLQVPEGYYTISAFNPVSNFLLSMRVDYPNEADRRRNKAPRLGGDIYIHGSCVTIGCVPLGDEAISKLYVLANDTARRGGKIGVHSYPMRLEPDRQPALVEAAGGDAELLAFWEELRPGYAWFEKKRTLPRFKVDPQGRYRFVE